VYQQQQTSSAIPWWVWMAAGVLAAKALDLVSPQLMKLNSQQLDVVVSLAYLVMLCSTNVKVGC
jgi:hypothetical protein